jgi:serine/threonine protein phosphatase 1
MLYYAIGDIHGCSAQLDRLLETIEAHAAAHYPERAYRLVLLGDYVDRGPDSAGVLDRAITLADQGHIVLPGNHEAMFQDMLAHPHYGASQAWLWLRTGGAETLQSYGGVYDGAGPIGQACRAVPEAHRAFLHRLFDGRPLYHIDREDGLFFVHAGVHPFEPLAAQDEEVFLWTRPLAPDSHDDPRWIEGLRVVHGHTPVKAPVIAQARIGLDTGAVLGGALSAGVFVDGMLTEVLSVPGWDRGKR